MDRGPRPQKATVSNQQIFSTPITVPESRSSDIMASSSYTSHSSLSSHDSYGPANLHHITRYTPPNARAYSVASSSSSPGSILSSTRSLGYSNSLYDQAPQESCYRVRGTQRDLESNITSCSKTIPDRNIPDVSTSCMEPMNPHSLTEMAVLR